MRGNKKKLQVSKICWVEGEKGGEQKKIEAIEVEVLPLYRRL